MRKWLCLLPLLAFPALADQCQITSPLPVPVSISGCTFSGILPPGSTSYIQNTLSPTTTTQMFSVQNASATLSLSDTALAGNGTQCVQVNNAGLFQASGTGACGTGGGGGSSSLAVTTGSANGFVGPPVSSPTAVVIFDSNTTNGSLQGGATYLFTLNPGSVTLFGQSIPASAIFAGGQLSLSYNANAIESMLITNGNANGEQAFEAKTDVGNLGFVSFPGSANTAANFGLGGASRFHMYSTDGGLAMIADGLSNTGIYFATQGTVASNIRAKFDSTSYIVSPLGFNTQFPSSQIQLSSGTFIVDGSSNGVGGITNKGPSGETVTYGVSAGSMTGAGLTSCSAASSAVTWNNTTNLFGCHSITGGGGGTSTLEVVIPTIAESSPTATIQISSSDFTGQTLNSGTTFYLALNPATTDFIHNQNSLQSGSTFYVSSGTVKGPLIVTGTTTLNGVTYTWPSNSGSNGQFLSTNGTTPATLSWGTSSGSGGSSSLAVTTGSFSGYSGPPISSPTAVVLFDSNTTNGVLQGGATYLFTLNPSSVTLFGASIPASSIFAGGALSLTYNAASIQGPTITNNSASGYAVNHLVNDAGTLTFFAQPGSGIATLGANGRSYIYSSDNGYAIIADGSSTTGIYLATQGTATGNIRARFDSTSYITSPITFTSSETITGAGGLAVTYGVKAATAQLTGLGTSTNVCTDGSSNLTTSGCNNGTLTANQNITLSGDSTGSGNTAIAVTASANQPNIVTLNATSMTVTNVMLTSTQVVTGPVTLKSSETITGPSGLGVTFGVSAATMQITGITGNRFLAVDGSGNVVTAGAGSINAIARFSPTALTLLQSAITDDGGHIVATEPISTASSMTIQNNLTLVPMAMATSQSTGTIWTDSTQQALMTTQSGSTQTLTGTIFTLIRSTSNLNTVGQVDMLGLGVVGNAQQTGLTLPQNFFTVGKSLYIVMQGTWTNNAAVVFTSSVTFGSTVIISSGAYNMASNGSVGPSDWSMTIILTCASTGASGSIIGSGSGIFYRQNSASSPIAYLALQTQGNTINTAASQVVHLFMDWGTQNTNNNITVNSLFIQALN